MTQLSPLKGAIYHHFGTDPVDASYVLAGEKVFGKKCQYDLKDLKNRVSLMASGPMRCVGESFVLDDFVFSKNIGSSTLARIFLSLKVGILYFLKTTVIVNLRKGKRCNNYAHPSRFNL